MSSGLRTSVEGGTVTATSCSSHLQAETSAMDKICRSTQCSSTTAISLNWSLTMSKQTTTVGHRQSDQTSAGHR